MNDDDDLFGAHTRSRKDDPWTSKAAAGRIAETLTEKQSKVYAIYRDHPHGLTEWEIEKICGSHGATWRTRVSELEQMGLLVKDGTRSVKDSYNPRAQRVIWKCKEFANPVLFTEPEPKRNPSALCKVCGQMGGYTQQATYVGAPEGGVTVHVKCLPAFYQSIDKG
jgi:hypothetical protein